MYFRFRPSLSPSNSLVILFIHSDCPLCSFGCHIFPKIIRFFFLPVFGMFSRHLLPVVGRIFFKFYRFTSFSCDSVSLGLLVCALFCCVAFLFSDAGSSFLLGCFSLTTLDVSGSVLLPCWLFIFWCVYRSSMSEKQPIFIDIRSWPANLLLVVWKLTFLPDFHDSYQRSSLWSVAPKIEL